MRRGDSGCCGCCFLILIPLRLLFMLLGGLFTALFVGWFLDRRVIVEQITNRGRLNVPVVNYLMFCLRYVAPVAVVFVFMQLVGII